MEIVVFTSMIVGGISNLIVSERALLSTHAHEHEIPFSKKKNLVTMRSSQDNMPGDALVMFLCYKAQAHIRRRAGNDRVLMSVQDSSGTNDVNFATPPEYVDLIFCPACC